MFPRKNTTKTKIVFEVSQLLTGGSYIYVVTGSFVALYSIGVQASAVWTMFSIYLRSPSHHWM